MESIDEFNTIDEFKTFIRSLNNKNPYEMFSIDEAAVAFNISKIRITKAVNDKELPEYKLDNKQRMLRRRDIEKWIDSKLKQEIILLRSKDIADFDFDKNTKEYKLKSSRPIRRQRM